MLRKITAIFAFCGTTYAAADCGAIKTEAACQGSREHCAWEGAHCAPDQSSEPYHGAIQNKDDMDSQENQGHEPEDSSSEDSGNED